MTRTHVLLALLTIFKISSQQYYYLEIEVPRNWCGVYPSRTVPLHADWDFSGVRVRLVGTHPLPQHVHNTSCVMFTVTADKGHNLVVVVEKMSLRQFNGTCVDHIEFDNRYVRYGPLCGNMTTGQVHVRPGRIKERSKAAFVSATGIIKVHLHNGPELEVKEDSRNQIDLKLIFSIFKDCNDKNEPRKWTKCAGNDVNCINDNIKCHYDVARPNTHSSNHNTTIVNQTDVSHHRDTPHSRARSFFEGFVYLIILVVILGLALVVLAIYCCKTMGGNMCSKDEENSQPQVQPEQQGWPQQGPPPAPQPADIGLNSISQQVSLSDNNNRPDAHAFSNAPALPMGFGGFQQTPAPNVADISSPVHETVFQDVFPSQSDVSDDSE